MKGMREDAYYGYQLRPFGSSRAESFGKPQSLEERQGLIGGATGGGAASSQRLTTNDALSYLKEVKDLFQDQREKYEMFLEVMKDFKAQRTDTTGVIARVKELFKGHNNLIFGFNTFLPKGYEITLDEDDIRPKKTVEFGDAISFVSKIKKRFQNDECIYKSFLNILNLYRKEHKNINEVHSEVASLFENHPDLLDDFVRFLPDTSATRSSHHTAYGRKSIQHYIDRGLATPSARQMHADKRRRDRNITHADRDLSVDRPELDDDKAMLKLHREHKKRAEKESREQRNCDQDDMEVEHDNNRDFLLFADRKKSSRKTEGMYSQAFIFCEKVKERLCSSDHYQAFLRCLSIYSKGIIKRNELLNLVIDLLGKYPDLMEEFNDFFERCENIDGFLAGVMSKKSLSANGHVSRSLKAQDKDREHKHGPESTKEKDRWTDKYLEKSIQELDLSNCERCTPSYRLLPDDYPISTASQRSKVGTQVLNDNWVSVTSGSEDFSFKHMRRNQYEESLFRCEDDRFELDMLLESVSSTSKRAEELLNKFNHDFAKLESPNQLEDSFTALNLRCIERLYGDHGLDVMDILRKNPTLALPVILTRLKQKKDEWTRCRSDFNKVWAEIYAKNHYKSLDHRSFYFKQQDSKNLNCKSLVAEIKELKEKRQKEDDIILSFATGNKHTVSPQLEYEYSDVSIHEDIYKLVQYSCKEVCSTKEQFNKVLNCWTIFLEPLLGVPSRPSDTTSSLDVAGKASRGTEFGIGKGDDSPGTNDLTAKSLKAASSNVDENPLLGLSKCSSKRLVNKDIVSNEDSTMDIDVHVRKSDLTYDSQQLGREHKNTELIDRLSGYCGKIASARVAIDATPPLIASSHVRSDEEVKAGIAATPSPRHDAASEDYKLKAGGPSVAASSEGKKLQTLPANLRNGIKVDTYREDSPGASKIEKEEGELSANGDSDEDNFAVYEDASVPLNPKERDGNGTSQCKSVIGKDIHCQGTEGANDADADDEDSENAFEAGDDVSGSESANDECSREVHEEEQDADGSKGESEGEAEVVDAHFVEGGDNMLPSETFLSSVKPLAKYIPYSLLDEERKSSQIIYGNHDFYVLFRLHQILYERVLSAKTNSSGVEMKGKNFRDSDSPDPYARFISVLYDLLDGSADNTRFEDECRAITGNQSYVLFTLDKLIYKLVKQLQIVATDEMDNKLLQLHEYEKSREPGTVIDSVYYENARFILQEENIFRLESASPSCLSIQLMDNMNEKTEVLAVSMVPDFAAYLYNDFLSVFHGQKEPHGVVLRRNKNKYEGLDDYSSQCMAMDGVKMFSGLEYKISWSSYKTSYVLDTEDFLLRGKMKRRKLGDENKSLYYKDHSHWNRSRVERFHKILINRLGS